MTDITDALANLNTVLQADVDADNKILAALAAAQTPVDNTEVLQGINQVASVLQAQTEEKLAALPPES